MKTGLERIAELEQLVEKLTERVRQLEARPGQVVMIPNENIERVQPSWPGPQPFLPPGTSFEPWIFCGNDGVSCPVN